MKSLLLPAGLAALLACAPEPTPIGTARAGLAGGTVAPDDHAIVLAIDEGGTSMCSGVLIRPDVVLTAGHCASGTTLRYVTDDASVDFSNPHFIDVVEQRVHPGFTGDNQSHDLATLRLKNPLDVTPISPSSAAPAAGDSLRAVGYGASTIAGQDSGVRRQVQLQVTDPAPGGTSFALGVGGCVGDSGGALIRSDGTLGGIMVGGDGNCSQFTLGARIDGGELDFAGLGGSGGAGGSGGEGGSGGVVAGLGGAGVCDVACQPPAQSSDKGGCSAAGSSPLGLLALLLFRRRYLSRMST